MDAISYVLGLETKKLRGAKLADLIHEQGQDMPKLSSAFVRMVFIDASQEEHVFTRSISTKGSAGNLAETYDYNGESGKEVYRKGLKTIGVTVDVPNCLVFQVRPSNSV